METKYRSRRACWCHSESSWSQDIYASLLSVPRFQILQTNPADCYILLHIFRCELRRPGILAKSQIWLLEGFWDQARMFLVANTYTWSFYRFLKVILQNEYQFFEFYCNMRKVSMTENKRATPFVSEIWQACLSQHIRLALLRPSCTSQQNIFGASREACERPMVFGTSSLHIEICSDLKPSALFNYRAWPGGSVTSQSEPLLAVSVGERDTQDSGIVESPGIWKFGFCNFKDSDTHLSEGVGTFIRPKRINGFCYCKFLISKLSVDLCSSLSRASYNTWKKWATITYLLRKSQNPGKILWIATLPAFARSLYLLGCP